MHVKSIWMNLGKTICYNLKYTPVRLHYVILPVFFMALEQWVKVMLADSTIKRLLKEMVVEGILRVEGERKTRRYLLKDEK